MNPGLELLQPYPFERLAALLEGVEPAGEYTPVSLAVGEPQEPPPPHVIGVLSRQLELLGRYPATRGMPELREAIAGWLCRRFGLKPERLDPERHVLPVNGTREALFAIAQAMVNGTPEARVALPNPGYQVYEGATLLAGAHPLYLDCTADNHFLPDLDAVSDSEWEACQLVYICTPGNPTGRVADPDWLGRLLELADRHDFIIASDECYSEIYPDEKHPPPGLLEVCARLGRDDFARCLVFHSLSKRSSLPGLRSGFVAGDAGLIRAFLRYRTYHGCAMSPPVQHASIAAWNDEAHVRENREGYRRRMQQVLGLLGKALETPEPDAAFYLWPRTPVSDTEFTLALYRHFNVSVVPGRFLARDGGRGNPGANRVRISLVAPVDACVSAATRILALDTALRHEQPGQDPAGQLAAVIERLRNRGITG